VPDLTKIRRLIGYEPKRSLEATLGDVIQYVGAQIKAEEEAGVIR